MIFLPEEIMDTALPGSVSLAAQQPMPCPKGCGWPLLFPPDTEEGIVTAQQGRTGPHKLLTLRRYYENILTGSIGYYCQSLRLTGRARMSSPLNQI